MHERSTTASAARARTLAAARTLFTDRGFDGTSLQMIADATGVTKAAIYHQYPTKSAILHAVLAPALDRLTAIVRDAESAPTPDVAFTIALDGLIHLVLDDGDIAALLRRDAAIGDALQADTDFRDLTRRLDRALIGPSPTPAARTALAIAGGGLMLLGVDSISREAERTVLERVMRDSVTRVLAPYREHASGN